MILFIRQETEADGKTETPMSKSDMELERNMQP